MVKAMLRQILWIPIRVMAAAVEAPPRRLRARAATYLRSKQQSLTLTGHRKLGSRPQPRHRPLIQQGLLGQGSQVLGAVGDAFNDASVGITAGITYSGYQVPVAPTFGVSAGLDSNAGPTVSTRVGFSRQAGPGNVTGVLRLPFTAGSPTPVVSIPVSPIVSVVGSLCGQVGVQIGPRWGGTSIGVIGYVNLGCR